MKSRKMLTLIISIIILGIVLDFLAWLITPLFGLGGFDSTTGRNSLPLGFPFRFYEMTWSDVPGSRGHEFLLTPFIINLILWIAVSATIVILIRKFKKKH